MKLSPIVALVWLVSVLPLRAEPIALSVLSDYLEDLTVAQANFTQISDDGAVTTGTLYIRRPGRARFEYDDNGGLVIAGGGKVAVFDPISNVPPDQFPLRRTPLSLILSRDVNLAASAQVINHSGDEELTSVLAQDPENPELGTLQMVFTGAPLELRQWVMTDEAGSATTVVLGPMERPSNLPNRMFNIPQEIEARAN